VHNDYVDTEIIENEKIWDPAEDDEIQQEVNTLKHEVTVMLNVHSESVMLTKLQATNIKIIINVIHDIIQ
jgi:hypothetical protein